MTFTAAPPIQPSYPQSLLVPAQTRTGAHEHTVASGPEASYASNRVARSVPLATQPADNHAGSPSVTVAADTRTFRERAADFFKNVPGKVAGAFKTFGEKVSHAFKTLPERAREFFHKTADFFKQLPAKVADGFRSLGERMKTGFARFNTWRENTGKSIKEGFERVANFLKGSPKNAALTETANTKPILIPNTVPTPSQHQVIPIAANPQPIDAEPLPIAVDPSPKAEPLSALSQGALDSIVPRRNINSMLQTATAA
jgi:hypothetical protein